MVHVVFTYLHLVAPTPGETEYMQKNISAMEKLWDLSRLPWTPKGHLLFCHCIYDMKRYGVLGDKVEQDIEKASVAGQNEHSIAGNAKYQQ